MADLPHGVPAAILAPSLPASARGVTPEDAAVRIVTLAGSPVRTLISGRSISGSYSITWDGKNDAAVIVPDGWYVAVLTSATERRAEVVIKGP